MHVTSPDGDVEKLEGYYEILWEGETAYLTIHDEEIGESVTWQFRHKGRRLTMTKWENEMVVEIALMWWQLTKV